jgi:hypothetical protein
VLSRGNLRKTKLFPKIVSLSSGDPDLSFTEYVVTSLYVWYHSNSLRRRFFLFFWTSAASFFRTQFPFFFSDQIFLSLLWFLNTTNRWILLCLINSLLSLMILVPFFLLWLLYNWTLWGSFTDGTTWATKWATQHHWNLSTTLIVTSHASSKKGGSSSGTRNAIRTSPLKFIKCFQTQRTPTLLLGW